MNKEESDRELLGKHLGAIVELLLKIDVETASLRLDMPDQQAAYYRLNAAWRALDEARRLLTPTK